VTEYGGLTENSQPWDITPMRDGGLWFTEENVDQVGVIYPSGAVYEFPVGMGNLPTFITTGPGGNVWFTEELGNKIVRLTPGLTGITPKMVEYPLLTDGALPWDINPGPDGNIWFTELAGRNIGKIAPNGTITEYPVPGEYGMAGIFADPRGDRMWFTENDSGQVGSIRLDGTVDPERFPTSPYPFGITAGPDGNMWFCVGYGNAIGRLNLSRAPVRRNGD
jgi:virginiamycin B lyase